MKTLGQIRGELIGKKHQKGLTEREQVVLDKLEVRLDRILAPMLKAQNDSLDRYEKIIRGFDA